MICMMITKLSLKALSDQGEWRIVPELKGGIVIDPFAYYELPPDQKRELFQRVYSHKMDFGAAANAMLGYGCGIPLSLHYEGNSSFSEHSMRLNIN